MPDRITNTATIAWDESTPNQLKANIVPAGVKAALAYPTSSVDNRLVRFDGTGGGLQGSGITVSDTDDISWSGDITQARIGGMWTDAPSFDPSPVTGVNIARVERLFVGAACDNDGTQLGTADWLSARIGFSTTNSEFASVAKHGRGAIVGAVRSIDNNQSPSNSIAAQLYAFNDNTSFQQSSWGLYIEAQRSASGAGFTTPVEVDIVEFGTTVSINPYTSSFTGVTPGLWLASGGEKTSPNDASVGLAFVNNHAKFQRGIVFNADSLTGTDGVTGTGEAIVMAKGHQINWYAASEGLVTSTVSLITLAANRQDMVVDDNGREFRNAASLKNFRVINTTGTLTGNLAVKASAAADPSLVAEGTATDIPITLTPKGAGGIRLDGAVITTGANASTGDVGFELGGERNGSGNVYIDMHATSGSDFEARLLRLGGANGAFQITNLGTGGIQFNASDAAAVTQFLRNGVEDFRNDGSGINLATGKTLRINSVQLLSARDTGWGAVPTATLLKTTFANGGVTTFPQVEQRLAAIITALQNNGIIGT